MERSERIRLQSIQTSLKRNLAAVEALLRTAQPPKRLSNKQVRARARAICQDIKARGGAVQKDQLREIIAKHGMAFTSVGALFGGGYLRESSKGITVGKRGITVPGKAKGKTRRVMKKRR